MTLIISNERAHPQGPGSLAQTDQALSQEHQQKIALPLSCIGHLRRLLAWVRLEYMLDPDMQRGFILGATDAVVSGIGSIERAQGIIDDVAEKIHQVPVALRATIKCLTEQLKAWDQAHQGQPKAVARKASESELWFDGQALRETLIWLKATQQERPCAPLYLAVAQRMLWKSVVDYEIKCGIVDASEDSEQNLLTKSVDNAGENPD